MCHVGNESVVQCVTWVMVKLFNVSRMSRVSCSVCHVGHGSVAQCVTYVTGHLSVCHVGHGSVVQCVTYVMGQMFSVSRGSCVSYTM